MYFCLIGLQVVFEELSSFGSLRDQHGREGLQLHMEVMFGGAAWHYDVLLASDGEIRLDILRAEGTTTQETLLEGKIALTSVSRMLDVSWTRASKATKTDDIVTAEEPVETT